MTQTPGTPAYMPPEVMTAKPEYDANLDKFSYGINLIPIQRSHMTQMPGTPAYMPPEVMTAKPEYDANLDKFSYGILMIHMFSGRWPEPQAGPTRVKDGTLIPVSEAE